jgi:predicted DNA binding CopG/RHH family protein
MATRDPFERDLLADYEAGSLKSVATKSELAQIKAAARATATKDRRVNIRLSSGDLRDIQARALQEGMPYQTLIASILHKYVAGRLEERGVSSAPAAAPNRRPRRPARKADV